MTDTRETAERLHAIAEQIMRKVYGPVELNWPDGLCNSIDDALRTARDEAWAEAAKVADDDAALWEREASKLRIGTDTWTACRIRMHVAMDIATAIRALAEKDVQP